MYRNHPQFGRAWSLILKACKIWGRAGPKFSKARLTRLFYTVNFSWVGLGKFSHSPIDFRVRLTCHYFSKSLAGSGRPDPAQALYSSTWEQQEDVSELRTRSSSNFTIWIVKILDLTEDLIQYFLYVFFVCVRTFFFIRMGSVIPVTLYQLCIKFIFKILLYFSI